MLYDARQHLHYLCCLQGPSIAAQSETFIENWGHDFARTGYIGKEDEKVEKRRQEEQRTAEPAVAVRTKEVGATIFSAKNIKISNDRLGLTRSAILLVLFIVIHAVGNLHVFKGQRLRIWMHLDGFCCKLHESFFQLLSVSHASLVSPVNP